MRRPGHERLIRAPTCRRADAGRAWHNRAGHQRRSAINHPTDILAALLSRSGRGDRRAFAELYRRVAPHLYAVALRLLRNADAASEVLQDGFVSIWMHAAEYQSGRGAPLTWMTSIIRHRALDVLRQPASRLPSDTDAVEALADSGLGPLERAIEADLSAAVHDCLKRLPGPQRQSIMLAFFNGLTHSQIAAHLAKPLGTVKTWVRQGLISLKGCLEP